MLQNRSWHRAFHSEAPIRPKPTRVKISSGDPHRVISTSCKNLLPPVPAAKIEWS